MAPTCKLLVVVGVVPNVSPYSLDYSTHFPVAGMTVPSIGVPLFTGFEHAADAQMQAGRVATCTTHPRFMPGLDLQTPTCKAMDQIANPFLATPNTAARLINPMRQNHPGIMC